MIVRTVTSVKEFQALEPAWRDLHAESPDSSFFNSFDFAFVWWQVYGALGELSIYVVEAVSESNAIANVLAIAPMYKTQSNLTRLFQFPTLRFIGRGGDVTPDDLNVLLTRDEKSASQAVQMLQASWDQSSDVQRLLFEDVPEQSRFFKMCSANPKYSIEQRESRLVAALPLTWLEFKQALTRNSRKRLKHRLNRLRDANTLTLSLCEGRENMQNALAVLVRLHRERQSSKGESAAFSSDEYVKFHESLIDMLHDKNALQFITLSDGSDIVGVEYMFTHAGSLLFFQTGFDPKYESVSPGHNMMVFAIKNAIEKQFTEIDLLKGDYPYKRSYATTEIKSVSMSSYRSSIWSALARILHRVKRAE